MGLFSKLFGKEDAAPAAPATKDVFAPAKGQVVKLADVADDVFASEALGKGGAVEPSEGKIYAPADGTVSSAFPTGHAIGITSAAGVEILIHVGIDTVEMNGDGFTLKTAEGKKVKKGDLLIEFDMAKVKAAGHPATVMVIITNTDDYAEINLTDAAEVAPGDKLIDIK